MMTNWPFFVHFWLCNTTEWKHCGLATVFYWPQQQLLASTYKKRDPGLQNFKKTTLSLFWLFTLLAESPPESSRSCVYILTLAESLWPQDIATGSKYFLQHHFTLAEIEKCPGCSAGPRLNCELFTSFNNVPLILRRSIALIKTRCSALRPNTAVTLESVKTLRVHWVYLPARPIWAERSACCRSSSVNRRWVWYGAGLGGTAPLGHYIKKHDAASTLTPVPAWPGALCHQDE